MDMLTVGEALATAARRHRDKPALIFGDEQLTYGELDRRVNQFAQGLISQGVGKGDRVALLLPNGLMMAEAYFGAARAGAVAVPINVRWTAPEIQYVLADAAPRLVIAGPEFREVLPEAPHVLVGDAWQTVMDAQSTEPPGIPVAETDPWVVVYTSGTTGRPKGAVRDHRSNLMIALTLVAELGLSSDDVGMALLPMFHVNSMWFVTLSLALGTTCVIYPHRAIHPLHVVEELNRHHVTYSIFVPTILSFLADAAEKGLLDPQHLRIVITSSAPLDSHLRTRLVNAFTRAQLYDIYGATEYGAVTCIRHRPGGVLGSVGWPLMGQSLCILNEARQEVPAGQVGEVFVAGPTLMTEYWNRPEATAQARVGDYLTLGDMGYLDDAGRLVLVDRKQDMIITSGENVYPTEVEDVLLSHPSVQLAGVVGITDARRGEIVVAAIQPREGQTVDLEALSALCRERLADYKRPRQFQVWEALPLGPTGKVIRRLVREQWSAHA